MWIIEYWIFWQKIDSHAFLGPYEGLKIRGGTITNVVGIICPLGWDRVSFFWGGAWLLQPWCWIIPPKLGCDKLCKSIYMATTFSRFLILIIQFKIAPKLKKYLVKTHTHVYEWKCSFRRDFNSSLHLQMIGRHTQSDSIKSHFFVFLFQGHFVSQSSSKFCEKIYT